MPARFEPVAQPRRFGHLGAVQENPDRLEQPPFRLFGAATQRRGPQQITSPQTSATAIQFSPGGRLELVGQAVINAISRRHPMG